MRGLVVCQDRSLDESLLGDDYLRSDRCVHGSVVAEASGARAVKNSERTAAVPT